MKPNWKKCAKRAYEAKKSEHMSGYEEGYMDGVRHSSEWIPALEDRPKRQDRYICLCLLQNDHGGTGITRCMAEYRPGTGWLNVPGNMPVAFWMEAPPVPKIEVSIMDA